MFEVSFVVVVQFVTVVTTATNIEKETGRQFASLSASLSARLVVVSHHPALADMLEL